MFLRIRRHNLSPIFLYDLLIRLFSHLFLGFGAYDVEAFAAGNGDGFEVVDVDSYDSAGEEGDFVVECWTCCPASEKS